MRTKIAMAFLAALMFFSLGASAQERAPYPRPDGRENIGPAPARAWNGPQLRHRGRRPFVHGARGRQFNRARRYR